MPKKQSKSKFPFQRICCHKQRNVEMKSKKIIFLLHSVMFLTVAFNFIALEKYDS